MTPTEPAPTAEPDAYEWPDEYGEELVLARNGWVRFSAGPVTLRLRPPFMGEYRTLRERLQAITDEVADRSDEVAGIATELEEDLKAIEADAEMSDRDKATRRRKNKRRDQKVAREFSEAQEGLWLAWWAETISTLCVDKTADARELVEGLGSNHDQMPPFMAGQGAAMRVLGHWRAGPLGRGSL